VTSREEVGFEADAPVLRKEVLFGKSVPSASSRAGGMLLSGPISFLNGHFVQIVYSDPDSLCADGL
jgi:hypothetical protein